MPLHFFTLPSEIRATIYELLSDSSSLRPIVPQDGGPSRPEKRTWHLRVNRQFYKEAVDLFYKNNTFCLHSQTWLRRQNHWSVFYLTQHQIQQLPLFQHLQILHLDITRTEWLVRLLSCLGESKMALQTLFILFENQLLDVSFSTNDGVPQTVLVHHDDKLVSSIEVSRHVQISMPETVSSLPSPYEDDDSFDEDLRIDVIGKDGELITVRLIVDLFEETTSFVDFYRLGDRGTRERIINILRSGKDTSADWTIVEEGDKIIDEGKFVRQDNIRSLRRILAKK